MVKPSCSPKPGSAEGSMSKAGKTNIADNLCTLCCQGRKNRRGPALTRNEWVILKLMSLALFLILTKWVLKLQGCQSWTHFLFWLSLNVCFKMRVSSCFIFHCFLKRYKSIFSFLLCMCSPCSCPSPFHLSLITLSIPVCVYLCAALPFNHFLARMPSLQVTWVICLDFTNYSYLLQCDAFGPSSCSNPKQGLIKFKGITVN